MHLTGFISLLLVLLFGYRRVAAFVWWSVLVFVVVLGGLIFLGSQLPDKAPSGAPKVEASPTQLFDYPIGDK
jgi:hypothetical protein